VSQELADEDLVAAGGFDELVVSRDEDREEVMESDQGDITGHGQANGTWGGRLVGQLVFADPGLQFRLVQELGGNTADGESDEFGGEPAIGGVCAVLGRHPGGIR